MAMGLVRGLLTMALFGHNLTLGTPRSGGYATMKTLITTAVVGLATLGFASSASAFHFLPKDSTFVATGAFTISAGAVSIPCQARLHGTTFGRGAKITRASFSGATCLAVVPRNLPWALSVGGPHSVRFHDVTLKAAGIVGVCGPGDLRGQDTVHGKITITGDSLPGLPGVPCSVTATLVTSPNLRIGGN